MTEPQTTETSPLAIDLHKELAETQVGEILDELDRELIGLVPVKTRIRQIAGPASEHRG